MWWLFVTLGIAVISAVEYFVDREHRDDARAAGRRSEEALERLDRSQRREVSHAVRGGPSSAPKVVTVQMMVGDSWSLAGRRYTLGASRSLHVVGEQHAEVVAVGCSSW